MHIRRSLMWMVAVIVLANLVAVGQNSPTQDPGTTTTQSTGDASTRPAPAAALSGIAGVDGPSDEDREDLPQIPSILGGRGSSLAFSSEMERSNYIRGGINFGAAYNDNAQLTPTGEVGDTTYSVFPNIAVQQTTSRTSWSLGYGAGLSVNQRLSNSNQGSHTLTFDSEFRLTPHLNLRAAEHFSLIAGMFGANSGSGIDPGQGGGNGTLITPLANQRTSQTVVEMNYHYALKDLVGASGSFYDLHYSDVTTGPGTLSNTRTAGGSAFWLHQIVRGNWAGLSYSFQRITFDPTGETLVHDFTVTDTFNISKTLSVSGFIGPEYSDNRGVAATGPNTGQYTSFSGWSVAGGLDGSWQAKQTSVTAGFSRHVSDGGGIVGAVRLTNVHAAVRRELRPGWSVTARANYGDNQSLTLVSTTTAALIKTTSVGASLERNVGRSLGLQLGYFRDFQDQSGSADPTQIYTASRNRVFVTLSYQWAKALGR